MESYDCSTFFAKTKRCLRAVSTVSQSKMYFFYLHDLLNYFETTKATFISKINIGTSNLIDYKTGQF